MANLFSVSVSILVSKIVKFTLFELTPKSASVGFAEKEEQTPNPDRQLFSSYFIVFVFPIFALSLPLSQRIDSL